MKLLRQARGDDPNHSRMPAARTDHDRRVPVRDEGVGELLQDFFQSLLFDRLPIAILPIQAARQQKGLLRIIRQQQIERILSHSDPPGGI